MTRTSFGDQIQQIWQARPVRMPRQGPVAGVAAGFGRRYDVDPVLIRVAFVVSAIFGGAGIVLYLLAWLLLSESGGASAAESLVGRGHSSQSPTKSIVLIVALAIAVSAMGPAGAGLGGSGVISMALMLAGWWMLHLRTPEPPPGTSMAFGPVPGQHGITATGYPGAAFPPGAPRTAGDMYTPYTSMYTPYTRLPDSYVPEPSPAETSSPNEHDGDIRTDPGTVTLTKPVSPQPTVLEKPDSLVSDTADTAASATDPAGGSESPRATVSATAGAEVPAADSPSSGGSSATRHPHDSRAAHSGPIGRTVPPSWDPLGVPPLAWDLPAPAPVRTPVAPPPKRPRSRFTPVVIGSAVLAAAGAGAAAVSGVEWMTPGRIAATALAVIGLGLVLGAFLRRGYGLLVLTAPLAGFVLFASAVGPIRIDQDAMGEHVWAPAALSDLASSYRVAMGSGELDLRSLKLTENRTVDVDVQMGDVKVLLPPGMTVRTHCTVRLGEALCPEGVSGPNTPGAPVLELNVDVRAGNAEVRRG